MHKYTVKQQKLETVLKIICTLQFGYKKAHSKIEQIRWLMVKSAAYRMWDVFVSQNTVILIDSSYFDDLEEFVEFFSVKIRKGKLVNSYEPENRRKVISVKS